MYMKKMTNSCDNPLKQKLYEVPDFDSIQTSTNTVVVISNVCVDLDKFYHNIPVTEEIYDFKKRNSKHQKDESIPNQTTIPCGSIISVQRKMDQTVQYRGNMLKKTEGQRSFLNCVTIVMLVEPDKLVNIKVCRKGKFHITGAKCESHYVNPMLWLYLQMTKNSSENSSICTIPPNENPHFVFNVVMRNYKFDIGFAIDREKLDSFINQETSFVSAFEVFINPSVNIKIPADLLYDDKMRKVTIFDCKVQGKIDNQNNKIQSMQSMQSLNYNNEWNIEYEKGYIKYGEYLENLPIKERQRVLKKKRYHTFLCFSEGSCILSSKGSQMPSVYRQFLDLIYENREKFEAIK